MDKPQRLEPQPKQIMEPLLSLFIGIGLSAACGFRVFVPLLGISLAAHTGHLSLAEDFAWLGSDVAVLAFGIATFCEIAAYYIPWLDNALDGIASPVAVIAGTIVTASMVGDMSPFLRWSLAAIAGGGAAGAVQAMSVLARGASTLASGGLANPILATAELGSSVVLSGMAIFLPLLALALLPVLVGLLVWRFGFARKADVTTTEIPAVEAPLTVLPAPPTSA